MFETTNQLIYYLVVYLPLWKIWLRQLGWWHSQLNGQMIQMFQTTNQYNIKVELNAKIFQLCLTTGYRRVVSFTASYPMKYPMSCTPAKESMDIWKSHDMLRCGQWEKCLKVPTAGARSPPGRSPTSKWAKPARRLTNARRLTPWHHERFLYTWRIIESQLF